MSYAVCMGPNKLKTVKTLLDAGVSIEYRTCSGGNVLMGAVENEDADPEVVRLVLEKQKCSEVDSHSIVNYRRKSTSMKRKMTYFVAKTLHRTGLSKSNLMKELAFKAGTTALNHAVIRGDVEIVKILLEHGADPYIENDLEMNAFDICKKAGPFPSVYRALQEHVDKE